MILLALPPSPLPTSEILNTLLLGGLLGAVGQGIRAIVGIKKMREETIALEGTPQLLDSKRLLGTLIMGFVAGLLATLPFFDSKFTSHSDWSQQMILTLIAAGYSGVDFIEGFLKNYLFNTNTSNVNNPIKTDSTDTLNQLSVNNKIKAMSNADVAFGNFNND
jgi:hypothetical protein